MVYILSIALMKRAFVNITLTFRSLAGKIANIYHVIFVILLDRDNSTK